MVSKLSLHAIIFEPYSWMNSDRRVDHEIFDNATCQNLINKVFIRHNGYSNDLPHVEAGSFLDVFIQSWMLLPEISKILACRRHRSALIYQGEFELLPQNIRHFCLTDCADVQPVIMGTTVTQDYLYACGAQMLMNLSVHLPKALIQRIPLLFSESIMGLTLKPHPKPLSLLDFRLAIQHAKFSHTF